MERFLFETVRLPRERRFGSRSAEHRITRVPTDEVLLTVDGVKPSGRRVTYGFDGALAGSHELYRHSQVRFELRSRDGSAPTDIRQKALRPWRSKRPTWEVTPSGGQPTVILEGAPFSALKVHRLQKAGEPIVTWTADGFEARAWNLDRAELELDSSRWPHGELIATVTTLAMWRTHRASDFS